MKTKVVIGSIIALAALVACNKEAEIEQNQDVYEYTFVIKDGSHDFEETRSFLDKDETGLYLKWENGDKLTTITHSTNSSNGGYSYSQNSKVVVPANASDPVTFTISSYKPLKKDDMVYCASPYISNPGTDPTKVTLSIPDSQKQDSGFFDGDALPMVAVPFPISAAITQQNGTSSESEAVSFYALGSVVEFDVFSPTNLYSGETVSSITFTTSDSDYIAGSFNFDLTGVVANDSDKLSISGYTGKSITVDLNAAVEVTQSHVDKDNAAKVYMVVAPGTHSGTLEVVTNVAKYSYTIPSREFKRSSVRRFGINLEKEGVREAEIPYTFESHVFELATSVSIGDQVIIANGVSGSVAVMKHYEGTNNNYKKIDATVSNSKITSTEDMAVLTIGGESGNLTLYDPATKRYVNATSTISNNYLKASEDVDNYAKWSISFSGNAAVITNTGKTSHNIIRYNAASDQLIFAAYDSGKQSPVYLYKYEEPSPLSSITLSGVYKTEFFVNDVFEYNGLIVTAVYENGREKVVTPTSITVPSMETARDNVEIVVSYTEGDVTKTASYYINISAVLSHTITWKANNTVVTTTSAESGNTLVLPEAPNPDDYGFTGYSFQGWTLAETINNDGSSIVYATNGDLVSEAVTYYAVFAQGDFSAASLTDVGSSYSLTSGDELVIVAKETSYGLYQQTVNTSYVKNFTFDNSVSSISADVKTHWTVTVDKQKYYLGDATNGYLYNSGSNNLAADTNNKSEVTLAYSSANHGYTIKMNNRYLSLRSDLTSDNANLWRMGGTGTSTGNAFFTIYKYVPATDNRSDFRLTL